MDEKIKLTKWSEVQRSSNYVYGKHLSGCCTPMLVLTLSKMSSMGEARKLL